ncbi:MAG TPA: hypothetical protein VFA95_12745 [Gammaproteobacteria bacterium]|nr:hypothetical protein [Gammaproteobacteria bacterium]
MLGVGESPGWRWRRLVPALAGVAVFMLGAPTGAAVAATRGDFVSFYPVALNEVQTRHPLDQYELACTRSGSEGAHISLLADTTGAVVLVAISRGAPRDVRSLLDPKNNPDATRDWAYVWDRNGDGKIDYLAYYLGVEMVVTQGSLPEGFPGGMHPAMNRTQLQYALAHMRMTFYYAADDNFDGRVDAMIFPYRDQKVPMWVKGQFVLDSSHWDGRVDRDWAFRDDITGPTGPAPRNSHGYRVRIDPSVGAGGDAVLAHWSALLHEFNSTVRACGAAPHLRR